MKTLIKAQVLIAMLFVFVAESNSGIIYKADFTGGLPVGWSIVDGYSDGNTWMTTNPKSRSDPNWTGTFMIVDSDWAGYVDMDEELITHSIDCSAYTNITLKFRHYFNQHESEICDVDVRVGGGSWRNVARYQGADDSGLVELDLSSIADGQPNVQIRWHYYDAYNDWYWGIDDIEILGEIGADGVVNYHAVICGIAEYQDSRCSLSYCDNDANDVRSCLLASGNWHDRNITLLINSAATKSAIRTAIENMASRADADDVCLFFFSGHGTSGLDRYPYDELDGYDEYLPPYDGATYDSLYETCVPIYDNCIRDDELGKWMADLPTNKYIVLLDTCSAGEDPPSLCSGGLALGQVKNVKGIGNIISKKGDGFAADFKPRITIKDLDDNCYGVVVAACEADEMSYSLPYLQNSLFTYYLVQGMAGPADINGDGWISDEECYDYVKPRVEYFTSDPIQFDSVQHPKMYDGHHPGEIGFLKLPNEVQLLEDFETGDFSNLPWDRLGNRNWTIAWDEKYSGNYSAKAGTITHSQNSILKVSPDFMNDGYVTFWRKVSSEHYFDVLEFYIDGVLMGVWSGDGDLPNEDWAEVGFPVSAGRRTLEWTYSKDYIMSGGMDTAWIDDIVFRVDRDDSNLLIFEDDFEDGVIDSFWNASGGDWTPCPISEMIESNGILTITIPGGQGQDCDRGLKSVSSYICRSFEASVDFCVPRGASSGMAWLSASSMAVDGDTYGVYFHLGLDYNIWYKNRDGSGWEPGRSAFGDENMAWHKLKLFYDGDTKTITSYVDNIFLNSKYVDLTNFEIGISSKVFANKPASTVEFDNFCLLVYGIDLYDGGEEHRSFSPQEVIEGEPGQNFEIKCHVRNGGDYDSGPFTVKFYASRDQHIIGRGRGSYYIGEKSMPGIPADGSAGCLWNGDFPTSIPAGSYYVGWIIDADNEIDEIDEDNNTAYKEEYQLTVVPQ